MAISIGDFTVDSRPQAKDDWSAVVWPRAVADKSDGRCDPKDVKFVRICDAKNAELGVLRRVDLTGYNSPDNVYLAESAKLKTRPPDGSHVHLSVANESEFKAHKRSMFRKDRRLLVVSLLLMLVGGLIQLSWDVGKYFVLFTPSGPLAFGSLVIKYLFLIVGVGGIATYRAYPRA
jgi:hypothetical protein